MAKAYQRIVNGKVVQVNAYAGQATTTTTAAKAAREIPGRPRVAAQPGSFSSGRDLPGQKAKRKPPMIPAPGQKDGLTQDDSLR